MSYARADLKHDNFARNLPSRIDAVVHLAQCDQKTAKSWSEFFSVNAAATQRLAEYARSAGARQFIYTSSGNVYKKSVRRLRESHPRASTDMYSLVKNVSEDVLGLYEEHFSVRILRLFAPYGPTQTARMIPGIINRVREGNPVFLTNGGMPKVNPIYIDDVVWVIRKCLGSSGHFTLNVAGPSVVSVREIAVEAGSATGRTPLFESRDSPQKFNLIADTGRLIERFGSRRWIEPTEGIRRMIRAAEK